MLEDPLALAAGERLANAKDGDGLLGALIDDPFDVAGAIPERRHVERGRHREQWIGIITGRAAHRELNA